MKVWGMVSPIFVGGFEVLIVRLCAFGRRTCRGGSYFSVMREGGMLF